MHVVDLYALVNEVIHNGVDVSGQHLSGKPFGGLLSLDGMHFSDTGYAIMANAYVDAVNSALGTSIAKVELVTVLANDPYSVEKLRAAGFLCAGQ